LTRRSDERKRAAAIIDALHAVVERLRAGESLRQSLIRAAGDEGSPLYPVATALAAGAPLVNALTEAAEDAHQYASRGGADLASVFCVLAVHAEAGGDPLPAVRALADRTARASAAREEAHAYTAQARLGARAILLLTPAFLVLLAVSDPKGAAASLAEPRTGIAIAAGIALQIAGALWIRTIVGGVAPRSSRVTRLPFVRALRALLVGRPRPTTDLECAETAEIVAFSLDAGLSVSAAIASAAPYSPGAFGDALRLAVAADAVPIREAAREALGSLDGEAPQRFVRALEWSAELGVPLADAMRALAGDVRESRSFHLTEDVRRASVRVLVPLSVLILPAFVLACLVPLFMGGLQGIAGS
jgi:tight adherence protein C